MPLFQTVRDLRNDTVPLVQRPYGVIEMADDRLEAVHLRPFPKLISGTEVSFFGGRFHRHAGGNRCLLFYNQPRQSSSFLALKYIVSSRQCSFKTFRGATIILDEIARLKGTDAIVCEVRNLRISDRLLQRWGWERHLASSRRRHFIKRFYGTYPEPSQAWALIKHPD
jgi:hypothetical protein